MTHKLFDNAKFGDMFLTTENKQAVFLRFAENEKYKFAILYVENWGNVQVFIHNGEEIYNDAAHSIISKKEKPVSEDLEEACEQLAENARKHKAETLSPFFSPIDYKQGVIDGVNWKEQQMMKDAIDTTIKQGCTDLDVLIKGLDEDKFSFGDKVKILVIKEYK